MNTALGRVAAAVGSIVLHAAAAPAPAGTPASTQPLSESDPVTDPVPAPLAERATIDNGLTVIAQRIPDAGRVAIALLLPIGERHDPPGMSGLAHTMEHLLVTCAAGDHPARTAEAWFGAYPPPLGANAQTGEDYTLIAVVCRPEDVERELADLAARLTDLRITAADLDRELSRLDLELRNMHEGMPNLVAMNSARAAVNPLGQGARKGGVMPHIRTITPELAMERWRAHYGADGAVLSIAGDIEPGVAREQAARFFAPVARRAPAVIQPVAEPEHGVAERVGVAVNPGAPPMGAGPMAVLALKAPGFTDPDYPAFVAIVSRAASLAATSGRGAPTVVYAPLDDPGQVFITMRPTDGQSIDSAAAALIAPIERAVRKPEATARAALTPGGVQMLLGCTDTPDAEPYLAAFRAARLANWGTGREALRARLAAVTAQDVSRVAERWFDRRLGALVMVEPVEPPATAP